MSIVHRRVWDERTAKLQIRQNCCNVARISPTWAPDPPRHRRGPAARAVENGIGQNIIHIIQQPTDRWLSGLMPGMYTSIYLPDTMATEVQWYCTSQQLILSVSSLLLVSLYTL